MPIGPNGERLPYPGEAGGMGGGAPMPDPSQIQQALAEMAQGAGAPQGAPPAQPQQGGSLQDRLLQHIEGIVDILGEDGEVDVEERAAIEDFRTKVVQLLAARTKERDGLLQGKASPRAIRRNA